MGSLDDFLAARTVLWDHRDDYEAARKLFSWPELDEFNWAIDYFDRIPDEGAGALWLVEEDGSSTQYTFGDLRARSNQVAGWLRHLGVEPGDRILLMLGNVAPLWEMLLAAMKLGAVVIPATTLLGADDVADRVARGRVAAVVTTAGLTERFRDVDRSVRRISVGGAPDGWAAYEQAATFPSTFVPARPTRASDPLFLYFTSGTTSRPKLVEHTHASYPVGHLTTLYALGLRRGDIHCNISSPGWAKHAWSCVFAPWNAEACVLVSNYERFDPGALLRVLSSTGATSLCAPPTVWRLLVQADLSAHRVQLREVLSAGEPLNPEIIEQVQKAWGLTIRDFYGQTETTALVGNTPGQPVQPGSMGRPLPGYEIALLDADGRPAQEGEICVRTLPRPLGLMEGYRDDEERTADVMRDGAYHTGDTAAVDERGYLTYVGRTDDVFKASDYRISPFELESVLVEHAAVVEAAVVPSPDARRTAVPKAFVVLAAGASPDAQLARDLLDHCRRRLAPFQRVRRIEFAELPKTVSGKIRRVELRQAELARPLPLERRAAEYWEEDFASS